MRFDVHLGVSVVRQAAQINDIDYSWINNRPQETKLTGEDGTSPSHQILNVAVSFLCDDCRLIMFQECALGLLMGDWRGMNLMEEL